MSTQTMPKTVSPVEAPESGSASLLSRAAALQRRYPILQALILVLVWAFGMATLPGFASMTSVYSLLVMSSFVGIVALGQTLVVLIGGADMSTPGLIVFGAVMTTQVMPATGVPFWLGIVISLVVGGLLGAGLGWVCHFFDINAMVLSFGIGSMAAGMTALFTGGVISGTAPSWLSALSSPGGSTFGIPIPPILVIWLVLGIVATFVLRRTYVGRAVYATGANMDAADNVVIPTRVVWTAVFALSAVCSTFAGVLLVGFVGTTNMTMGQPYLFLSLAAVVVGGTVFGGPGSYPQSCIGAVLLTVLSAVLVGHGSDYAMQQVFQGVLIIIGMMFYGRERSMRDQV